MPTTPHSNGGGGPDVEPPAPVTGTALGVLAATDPLRRHRPELEVRVDDLDRDHLAIDVIDRVGGLRRRATHLRQAMLDRLPGHRECIERHGQDMPGTLAWRRQSEAP